MIFTNGPRDTIRAAFERYTQTPRGVLLACPFFSCANLVGKLVEKRCSVRLIVRLAPATNPAALKEVIQEWHVPVRYFTSPYFHGKIYIFGDEIALVGSANLTDSGIQSNREVCVGIDREDPRFEQLVQLFQGYWNEAAVLDRKALLSFEAVMASNRIGSDAVAEAAIRETFGDVAFRGGVQVGRPAKSHEQVYLDNHKRGYQELLAAFRKLEHIYREFDRRQQPENVVPLRIEIDSFFSFIRENFAQGESYQGAPTQHGSDLDQNVRQFVQQWFSQRWDYLDKEIPGRYARVC